MNAEQSGPRITDHIECLYTYEKCQSSIFVRKFQMYFSYTKGLE